MTETDHDDGEASTTRRALMAAVVAAGAGASFTAGRVSAAPTGTFPQAADDPLLKLRADRLRLVPRSTDPSSPDNGTLWYNDSA